MHYGDDGNGCILSSPFDQNQSSSMEFSPPSTIHGQNIMDSNFDDEKQNNSFETPLSRPHIANKRKRQNSNTRMTPSPLLKTKDSTVRIEKQTKKTKFDSGNVAGKRLDFINNDKNNPKNTTTSRKKNKNRNVGHIHSQPILWYCFRCKKPFVKQKEYTYHSCGQPIFNV
jgi:hypothetical protein